MLTVIQREAWAFVRDDGSCPFKTWFESINDIRVQARVDARIRKMEEGSFGDAKPLDDGIYEARIHLGAGWRVYYGLDGNRVILLLIGGSKRTQKKDFKKAKAYWAEYENEKQKATWR